MCPRVYIIDVDNCIDSSVAASASRRDDAASRRKSICSADGCMGGLWEARVSCVSP